MPSPKYILIASSTCDADDTPELFSGTMARFYATLEAAQAAMVEDLLDTINDEAREQWDENEYSKELGKQDFLISNDVNDATYRVEPTVATWETYEAEGSAISTWQIIAIPETI